MVLEMTQWESTTVDSTVTELVKKVSWGAQEDYFLSNIFPHSQCALAAPVPGDQDQLPCQDGDTLPCLLVPWHKKLKVLKQ